MKKFSLVDNGKLVQTPGGDTCSMQGDSPRCMTAEDTVRTCVGKAVDPGCISTPCTSHCASVTALALCGPHLFSASSDSTIRAWNAETLQLVKVLRAHRCGGCRGAQCHARGGGRG